MSNALISVIIPVYNVEKYLSRCIDSVINQTYKNLEIILIDDGSTDNSGKICDEYAIKDNRIKVIHKQNGGVSSARNIGLDVAKGNYIGFVDSDDYIENDMYEILYELLVRNQTDISCCNKFVLKKNKFVVSESFPTKDGILSFDDVLNDSKHDFYIWNKLFNKNLIGNVRFNEQLTLGEDLLFTYQVLQKIRNIAFYKEAKYYYCDNSNSITRIRVFKKEYINQILFYEKLLNYCEKNKLKIGYKKYKHLQINWIINFLSWIARETPIRNKESLELLLKYARKNLFYFMFGKFGIKSKIFLIVSCLNFNLASNIYKLMLKLKVIK
ncbi:glycosyltransferase family 2 protein [Candidatus Ruminimicrobium bovinum]|uniref:glycosyltransferase family 2 protein n=1 Tax=Candidatus Ruminimicrobium bovinum TaxID=3242779 RepID=UPI0039B98759